MYHSFKLNSKWLTFILITVKMKSVYAQIKAILPLALIYFREDPNAIMCSDFFRLNLVPKKDSGCGYRQDTSRNYLEIKDCLILAN